MGSYTKKGFDYYNVDTDRYQDIKIKRLKKGFKCEGMAVYDYFLCEIYRVKGYFIHCDDSTIFDVAEYFDLEETRVIEIITGCCEIGLFDKKLREKHQILTSKSIQFRFLAISGRSKRKEIEILPAYNLTEELEQLPEVLPKTPEVSHREENDISGLSENNQPENEILAENFSEKTKNKNLIPESHTELPEVSPKTPEDLEEAQELSREVKYSKVKERKERVKREKFTPAENDFSTTNGPPGQNAIQPEDDPPEKTKIFISPPRKIPEKLVELPDDVPKVAQNTPKPPPNPGIIPEIVPKIPEVSPKTTPVVDLTRFSNLNRQPDIPDKQLVDEVFLRNGGTLEMAERFYDKNTATGWFINGSPIKNFANLIPSYISHWNKNEERDKQKNNHNGHKPLNGSPKLGTSAARINVARDW